MTFRTYWLSLDDEQQADLAKRCKSTPNYLYLIALGHKRAGYKLALALEEQTGGEVTRHDIRGDIYGPAPDQRAA